MQLFDAINLAQGAPSDVQQLACDIAQVRGFDPWEPVFVRALGSTIPRWQSIAAELALIKGAPR